MSSHGERDEAVLHPVARSMEALRPADVKGGPMTNFLGSHLNRLDAKGIRSGVVSDGVEIPRLESRRERLDDFAPFS
jgi:hypothetical protein